MHFEEGHVYHIINRSNEKIFYCNENYLFFIRKIRRHLEPICEIIAWCLMPNHFHLIIMANAQSTNFTGESHRPGTQLFSKNLGIVLSSYTRAINNSNRRRGKLFGHKTKALQITHRNENYLLNCIHYIHHNPLDSGIVNKLEDWEYSSYLDYSGKRNGTLINRDLIRDIFNIESLSELAVD